MRSDFQALKTEATAGEMQRLPFSLVPDTMTQTLESAIPFDTRDWNWSGSVRREEVSRNDRFPWSRGRRQLWPEFHRIQNAAKLADGSPIPKGGKNGFYGFHDIRRGFATMNAASMDLFELQALMQHKTLTTTQGYVSMAKRLLKPVNNLFVPTIPQIGETA